MQNKKPCKCTKCQKEKKEQKFRDHGMSKKVSRDGKREDPQSDSDRKATSKLQETKGCHTNCNESIDIQVDVIPEVLLKQLKNHNRTSFEIELDVAAMPNCRVVKKEVFDPVSCRSVTKYVLLVESDVKLDCKPIIKQISGKPYAKYEMDVIVDTEQHVKIKE